MFHKRKSIAFFASAFVFTLFSVTKGDGLNNEETDIRVPAIDLGSWFESPISSTPMDRNREPEAIYRDLTREQLDIVQRIRKACHEVGFFQITGVPGSGSDDNKDDIDTLDQTWNASRDFFDLSIEEKTKHTTTDNTKYPYGYERSETLVRGKRLDGEKESGNGHSNSNSNCEDHGGDETCTPPKEAVADLKETFALGPPDGNGSGMPPRRWIDSPNVSPNFRTALEAYYALMEDLALVLLQIFAIALEEPPDFFRDKMDRHMSALRLVHYYPLEKPKTHTTSDKESQEEPEPIKRLVRAGAHTDYGAVTILAVQDEGLEVLLRDASTTDGDKHQQQQQQPEQRWYPVPLIPGAFVVNLGDLMQHWTNNEWISTMHRVVMPSTEAQERRYSMAYFVNINGDTPIEPLKCCRGDGNGGLQNNGRVMTAGEHLMAKHLASMGIIVEDDNVSGDTNESCESSE